MLGRCIPPLKALSAGVARLSARGSLVLNIQPGYGDEVAASELRMCTLNKKYGTHMDFESVINSTKLQRLAFTLVCLARPILMHTGPPPELAVPKKYMIGDYSKLIDLIEGDFEEVSAFKIIDCRFPYEYEGGHIQGAENIWDRDTLVKQFFDFPVDVDIGLPDGFSIVYHCEFSSKRGPDMLRFMRQIDRERNAMFYPRLHYPELYLLDGGYSAFYKECPELCRPHDYVTMRDERFKDDYKKFKYALKYQ